MSILLKNIHLSLRGDAYTGDTVKGDYWFYHYGVGKQDDRGWGCGYRTLQSLCSWVRNQLSLRSKQTGADSQPAEVPTIQQIQEALVAMGDKEAAFVGSKTWIGSFEVCLCLDYVYDIPCKIVHVQSGRELSGHIDDLVQHFQAFGSPVMMGGDKDSSSKGILGVSQSPAALLVMDPHFYCKDGQASVETLIDQGYIKWVLLEDFDMDSFYNLCLPKLKAIEIS